MSGAVGGAVGRAPWSRADAVKAATLVAIGAVVWMVGWFRLAEEPALEQQIAPFNVVVVGFVLIGAGYASWFLAGRRAVGVRRRLLLTPASAAHALVLVADGSDSYVGSERYFHRPACAMVTDRAWTPQPRTEHERAGRVPCGLCRP